MHLLQIKKGLHLIMNPRGTSTLNISLYKDFGHTLGTGLNHTIMQTIKKKETGLHLHLRH